MSSNDHGWIAAVAVLWIVAINLWTMLRFWQDRMRAMAGDWRRIPEADLLFAALLGGSPGAWLARRWFRHKTRKRPFSTRLAIITAAQAGALIGMLI